MQTKEEKFFDTEHVIFQSFGKFGDDTPTLFCVCKECNSFFGNEIDTIFARDSVEGITRYKKGLMSREARPQAKLIITLAISPEMGEFAGCRVWINGKTGKMMPLGQICLLHKKEKIHKPFLKEEFVKLDWQSEGFTDKNIRILGATEEEHDELEELVKKKFPTYKFKENLKLPEAFQHDNNTIPVEINRRIDHQIKRAMAKTLFNFTTFYIGVNEVLKDDWNKARNYIRFNKSPLMTRHYHNPFWEGYEQVVRQEGGYNVRIKNDKDFVLGEIQLFNFPTYQIKMVENYNIPKDQETAYHFVPSQPPIPMIKKVLK